ncbi:MAG: LamB/YcsF family protein [Cytophagaceae bacterium]|nr:LamB/YcsF family protein [Cytophagaceae bacterium]
MLELNCDMGEIEVFMKNGHDASLMPYLDSVNIACGFHAGSEKQMRYTIEKALKHNLKIGAHPGFNDSPNFGRKEILLSHKEIKNLITIQLFILSEIAEEFSVKLNHVKPHGALYNISAKNHEYANAIAEAVFGFSEDLILVGLSGSKSIEEAQKIGLKTMNEVFADRYYRTDKSLAARTGGGVIEDLNLIELQVESFLENRPVKTIEGTNIQLNAETICIHSDTPNALKIAQNVSEKVRLFYQSTT